MKIKPREFPLNALVAYEGRLIELMKLHKYLCIEAGPGTWGAWLKTKRYRKLVSLINSTRNHITWLFDKKFPECHRFYWEPFRGGYIFFPASHFDKHHT